MSTAYRCTLFSLPLGLVLLVGCGQANSPGHPIATEPAPACDVTVHVPGMF